MTNQLDRQTIAIHLTITTEKPVADLIDKVAQRAYTIDGVIDSTASLGPGKYEQEQSEFEESIDRFNHMYKLPVYEVPTLLMTLEQLDNHLDNFYKTLFDELNEVEAIREKLRAGASKIEILTELADWLGDIQVYAASEMRKFGLPIKMILGIIMASNMSKLGEDGKPIYDERGKVLKGPNYWKPEPMIKRALEAAQRQSAKTSE